jgi:hypothetical protein
MDTQGSVEWHRRMLRAWHLALLRFAVTMDNGDRLNVLAIASEIDRLGQQHQEKTDFGFFRKTSSYLCAAILQSSSETSSGILRQYLARIDDVRLKCALMAALEIELHEPALVKNRSKPDVDLWKGLSPRVNVEH